MRTTLYLDLWGTHIRIQRCIHGFTHQRTFLLKSEVLQKHSGRKYLRQGIGEVLSCSLWPRTMHRLKERRMLTQ